MLNLWSTAVISAKAVFCFLKADISCNRVNSTHNIAGKQIASVTVCPEGFAQPV